MGDKSGIEWTEVAAHPGYHVNRDGQVRGRRGTVMRPLTSDSGHLYILARHGPRHRKMSVHRAVLETFVGPCPSGQEARHLNGDASDNRLANLAWGTRRENAADRMTHGVQRRGEQAASAKLTEAQVRDIRLRRGRTTLRALAAEYGVSHTAIRRAALGIKWRHVA